jgi:hypothetical protein
MAGTSPAMTKRESFSTGYKTALKIPAAFSVINLTTIYPAPPLQIPRRII